LLGVVALSIRLLGGCVEHTDWLLFSLLLLVRLDVHVGRLRGRGGRRVAGGWVADRRGWPPLRLLGLVDGDEAGRRHGGDSLGWRGG